MLRRCPNCRNGLTAERTPHGIAYVCRHCRGRAMALPVLRNAGADRETLKRLWFEARSGSNRLSVRPCPHCNRPMTLVYAPTGKEPVPLDVCPRCQIVWFDPSEYEALPRSAAEARPRQIQPSAGTVEAQKILRRRAASDDVGYTPDQAWKWLVAVLGMPVECNEPERRKLPVLTWMIAGICALTLALTYARLSAATTQWGFIPAEWNRHGGLTLLTSFFLHGGILHFLSNVYFLIVFGDNVEEHLGLLFYLPLLFGAHLAGVALHGAMDPNDTTPLVGASAGIGGVIACYAVLYPKVRLGFLFWWYRFFSRWLLVPAWGALILYMLLQIFGAAMQINGFSRVSYLGHIGGLTVGVAVGAAARTLRNKRVPSFLRTESADAYRSSREHVYRK